MPRTHKTGPRSGEAPETVHGNGRGAERPAERRTRDQAHQAALDAQTQGGQAGIASGLAAIAHAILARTENP